MRKSCLFLFALMLTMLGISDAMAQKIYRAELDKSMFKAWNGTDAEAEEVEPTSYVGKGGAMVDFACENNFFKSLNQGAVVFGNTNVYSRWYANLTGTTKIYFKGDAGMAIRVLMNRPDAELGAEDPNGGTTVERRVEIGVDGTGELDLSSMDYIHLNCIKIAWGSPMGVVQSIELEGTVKPVSGLLSMINNGDAEGDDLESFPVRWDGPNEYEANSRPEIIEGEGIDGGRCFKVISNDNPTEIWHTQFFIKADEVLPRGTKWQLKMAIKADQNVKISTSAQGQPCQWKGGFIEEFGVGTEWQEYTWSGEIGVDDFQTIAFDLNNGDEEVSSDWGGVLYLNRGVSFYFDNIEFGVDLGGSSPMNDIAITAGADVICVNFNGNTNIASLVKDYGVNTDAGRTVIFDNSCAAVSINGENQPIVSVEGRENGNLYIFLDDEAELVEDDESDVKVAFTNPVDANRRLLFTTGKWEGQAVPDFSGISAEYDEELGVGDIYSCMWAAPALLNIEPEAGSFNLPTDFKEFKVTFNQDVKAESLVAKLGAETLAVSPAQGEAKTFTLTRTAATEINGAVELVISEATGAKKASLKDPIVIKYSYGSVSADAQPETLFIDNFGADDKDNYVPEGWVVNSDAEEREAGDYGAGCRVMVNRANSGQGFTNAILYVCSRSLSGEVEAPGRAYYGALDDYKIALTTRKYTLTLGAARWDYDGTERQLKVLVCTEEGDVLVEQTQAVVPDYKTTKDATRFKLEFEIEDECNVVLKFIPLGMNGEPNGYGDACAIGDIKLEYIPDVLGIIETLALNEALENAKSVRDANSDECYAGDAFTALDNLINEVEANKTTYTDPAVYTAKAEELNEAAKAMTDYVALCQEYYALPVKAFEVYTEKKEITKFTATEEFMNLVETLNKYATIGTEVVIDEETLEENTIETLESFTLFHTEAELNAAKDELSNAITKAEKMLTEGESHNWYSDVTSGYAALHDRLRRGIELLQNLGVSDDEPEIVYANSILGDSDEAAEVLMKRANIEILKGLSGEGYNFFEDGDRIFDLSVFVKNPNVYCEAYSTETPGWTTVKGNTWGWSSWIGETNHTASTPYPEDCKIHAGWHPIAGAAVEQTITNLPAGVYTIQFQSYDNASWDSYGTYAYVKLSDTPIVEYGEEVDPDFHYAAYSEFNNAVIEGLEITDGLLTIGCAFGPESQAFLDGVQILMTAPIDYFDYDKAYQEALEGNVNVEKNMLYVADDTRITKSNSATLPISMKNEQGIKGLQFDIVLPNGMTFVKKNSTINENRSYSHKISSNTLNNRTVRMVITSDENDIIFGNDGVLLNVGLNASSMSMGYYAVTLKNITLTNSRNQSVNCSDKTFYVKVGGKMGDVNNDDQVNVTDVVLMIDHILQRNPDNFYEAMADVNDDGTINVTDVVKVIDVILGRAELARTATREYRNQSDYTAFQMDLIIPTGYVLESVSLTDIAKDSHSLAYNMLADGRCRVVVYSMDKEALPGTWDEVIRLNLRGQGNVQVNIDYAAFVTIGGECHELQLNGTTAITQLSTLDSQSSTIYDLQGRKVEKNAKGILLENGRKTVRK